MSFYKPDKKVVIKNRKGLFLSIKLNIAEERKKLIFLEHGMAARKEYPHMKVMEDVFASNGYNVVNIDASDSLNESEHSKEVVNEILAKAESVAKVCQNRNIEIVSDCVHIFLY